MNTTENNHKELLPYLGKRFQSRAALQPFFNLLESDPKPGINDFSIPWHRTAFDYCDAQYIIIRHAGMYNIVKWDWSQYSGYCVDAVSDFWFEEITKEHHFVGTCEFWKNNHWEYDYNRGRFCSSTNRTVVKVKQNGKYGFIYLSTNKSNKENPFLYQTILNEVKSDWYKIPGKWVIDVTINGKANKLTQDGLLLTPERDLTSELEYAKANLTDKSQILLQWIQQGKPCAKRYGLSFRGAKAKPITTQEAENLLPKYDFGKGFYEIRFELLSEPTLVFNEYSANDMY